MAARKFRAREHATNSKNTVVPVPRVPAPARPSPSLVLSLDLANTRMPVALITGGSEGKFIARPRGTKRGTVSLVCKHLFQPFSSLIFSESLLLFYLLSIVKGIGLATAVKLASQNYSVAICGRTAEKLAEAAKVVKTKTGKDVLTIAADVRKREDCERVVKETVDKFGGLNVLVK